MRFQPWRCLAALLFAGICTAAPAGNATETPAAPEELTPGPVVIGKTPRPDPSLPQLRPDQFTDCYSRYGAGGQTSANDLSIVTMMMCQRDLARDQRIVVGKCINHDGQTPPPVIIQACNELLERNILQGHERLYLYVNRAMAEFAGGDSQRALEDYNKAVELAPRYAQPYYYRGVFHVVQKDADAALQDFDTAVSLNPKFAPARLQRAKLHITRKDLDAALADYTEVIRLQPKTAEVWRERGYLRLMQQDYEGAIKDESEAIRLDPKLAQAWFLRGAAHGDRGESRDAVSDISTAVRLDPSLDRYISSKDRNATLRLPPF